jgi:hypothetical protein
MRLRNPYLKPRGDKQSRQIVTDGENRCSIRLEAGGSLYRAMTGPDSIPCPLPWFYQRSVVGCQHEDPQRSSRNLLQ